MCGKPLYLRGYPGYRSLFGRVNTWANSKQIEDMKSILTVVYNVSLWAKTWVILNLKNKNRSKEYGQNI
jgi:hypothetical protein